MARERGYDVFVEEADDGDTASLQQAQALLRDPDVFQSRIHPDEHATPGRRAKPSVGGLLSSRNNLI